MKINRCLSYTKKVNKRRFCIGLCVSVLAVTLSGSLYAQSREETLVVAGPRTPESLDQEYPPTEAGHEARRNIFERLLEYRMVEGDNGAQVEDFNQVDGALAESWEVSQDNTSITFNLRQELCW